MTDEEITQAFTDKYEYERLRALKAVFEKDSKSYELSDFNLFVRFFCLFKTWVCLNLKRTNGSYMDKNKFCILAYDERSYPDGTSWDAVWVSPYLFKDWNVCLAIDGT